MGALRITTLATAGLLLLSACSTTPTIGVAQRIRVSQPTAIALAEHSPAEAAAEAEALEPLKVQAPRLWVRGAEDVTQALEVVRATKGVAWAAPMRVGSTTVAGEKATAQVTLAAIDPESFRPLAPQATADALDVWRRMQDGDATFAPFTARRLRIVPGEPVLAAGSAKLRVGAIAPTLDPPLADVLITRLAADAIGMRGEETILVAVDRKFAPATVARRLRNENLTVEVLEARRPAERSNVIEPFTYVPLTGGMIEIDPAWVARNIVTARVPVFRGVVRCHRIMIPQLRAALQEVEDSGLAELIDLSQYGGCWVPRHIDFNPMKSISMHAWGLAIDFNVSTNQLGAEPQMDPRIVEIFQRWGFTWGGHWSRPDGMHFQLSALVENVEG